MRPFTKRSARLLALLAVLGVAGVFPFAGTASSGLATTPTGDADLLMLESIVGAGADSVGATAEQVNEADVAEGLGLTVDIVTDEQWGSMTAADFARYKAIVLGDPFCQEDGEEFLAAPIANGAVWGPVVRGNVVVHTFDAAYHSDQDGAAAGTRALMGQGMQQAASTPGKTGLYMSTSCYNDGVEPVLNAVDPGWTFVSEENWDHVDCDIIFLADVLPGALAGLTEEELSDWGCSTHAFFSTWPSDVQVLAIISAETDEGGDESAPSGEGDQVAATDEGDVPADDTVLDGITGSPVILLRPAIEDPVVVEPTFTG